MYAYSQTATSGSTATTALYVVHPYPNTSANSLAYSFEEQLDDFERRAKLAWRRACSNWFRTLPRRGIWLALLAALLVASSAGCVGGAEVRARSALDALAQVVDPAWALAEDSCLASQRVVAVRETAGGAEPAQTDATLALIRAKCDEVTDAFERIRAAHLEATRVLDAGKVGEAEQLLEQILAQWNALRGAS